jgi:methionine transaminase
MIQSKLPNVGTNIFTVMSGLANEHQAINLSQGFPNFNPPEALQTLIFEAMQNGANQYAPMAGLLSLRTELAIKAQNLYGADVNPETEITITAGGTQAIFTAITAAISVGDEVILIEPCYDSYRPAVELCGGVPVIFELHAPDYAMDWTAFAKKITSKTKLIIFNTPNNPSATVWTAADLLQLQNLVADTNIMLLSDEVYEHLIFDGAQHQSVLRYPELRKRAFITYSFGKTYHATGWKSGYCIAPESMMREFRKVHQFNVFSVFTPVQVALAEFVKQSDHYLSLPDFYQQKRDYFAKAMEGSRFKLLPAQGTYFQLAAYSDISHKGDLDFCKWLTAEHKVAAIPVSAFYSSGLDERIIRFCFAKTNDVLDAAADILKRV